MGKPTPAMVLAVDPGVRGGIAVLTPDGEAWASILPLAFAEVREKIQGVVVSANIARVPLVCFLEGLHAMPGSKRGGVATWKLCESWTIAACAIEVETGKQPYMIRAQTWQKGLCIAKSVKRENRLLAQGMFPADKHPGTEDTLHGTADNADRVADALLIAAYGRGTLGLPRCWEQGVTL